MSSCTALHFRAAFQNRRFEGIYHCTSAGHRREMSGKRSYRTGVQRSFENGLKHTRLTLTFHTLPCAIKQYARSAGTRSTHTTLQRTTRARKQSHSSPSISPQKDPATPRARNAASGLDCLMRPTSRQRGHPSGETAHSAAQHTALVSTQATVTPLTHGMPHVARRFDARRHTWASATVSTASRSGGR